MAFVIDASVVASWILPDEKPRSDSDSLEDLARHKLYAPALFWYELRNILLVSERRKRITAEQSQRALDITAAIGIILDHEPISEDVLKLARDYNLTAYDAAYLELAKRKQMPIRTIDARLEQAARKALPVH